MDNFANQIEKQVDKSAYEFFRYCGLDRWASYHYQLREILRGAPQSVLEVGVGDGVVAAYIKANTSVKYTSVDVADDVGADVIGSVVKLPFPEKSFDVVCAFEVLEHLPFEQLDTALSELARVARRSVIISIPHFGPPIKFSCKIPFLPEIRIAFKIPLPFAHTFNGQHYWELGKRGYPPRRFRSRLAKFFLIDKEYVPFENQYHHFFILIPKV